MALAAATGEEASGDGETAGGGELTSNHVQRELSKLADVTRASFDDLNTSIMNLTGADDEG